jgi:hypothetical protein
MTLKEFILGIIPSENAASDSFLFSVKSDQSLSFHFRFQWHEMERYQYGGGLKLKH